MRIAIGTRFYGQNRENDLPRLAKWAEGALSVSPLVFVAVNVDEDKVGTIEFLREKFPAITAIPVTPWGKFVMPLNAMILAAAKDEFARAILFTSAEFPPSKGVVDVLVSHFGNNTLVAGARLAEHDFHEGIEIPSANGLQIPWNTYALWNLDDLGATGFPLLGDSPSDPDNAGVEEMDAIRLWQKLEPNAIAKLVSIKGMPGEWDMQGWDEARHVAHKRKMASKIQRPRNREIYLGGFKPIRVQHIG